MPEIDANQKRSLQLARAISTSCFSCSGSECQNESCPLHVWNAKNKQWLQWNVAMAADAILRFCAGRCSETYARCSDRPEGKSCPLFTGLTLSLRTFGKL